MTNTNANKTRCNAEDNVCGNCRFYVDDDSSSLGGTCRINPPVPIKSNMSRDDIEKSEMGLTWIKGFWPSVCDEEIGCGKFEPRIESADKKEVR